MARRTKRLRMTPFENQSATRGWLGRFWADQDGNISFLAVAGAVVMMVFGGIGVDMMHAELKRNKVQNTLDRAVLAAADMDNTMDPELVVNDYFRAMGMSDALVSVDAQTSSLSKQVSAAGHEVMPSNFMGLIGVDNMQAAGSATASNAVKAIEISLVLDVSGSMSGDKLAHLKAAAKSFVDTVLPAGENNDAITISVVPYSATVNAGTTVQNYFTFDLEHTYSYCARFNADDFGTTELDPDEPLRQLAHFDMWGGYRNSYIANDHFCSEGDSRRIVPLSNDPDLIKTQIDALFASGNTAIDVGMKWGAALLDPSTRSAVSDMITDGVASPNAVGRPLAYHDPQVQKYIIVMTDGQNTTQYDLKDSVKNSWSDIWVDNNGTEDRRDDVLSIRVDTGRSSTLSDDTFLWSNLYDRGVRNPYRRGVYDISSGRAVTPVDGTLDGITYERGGDYGGPVRLRNTDLYASYKTSAIANKFYWQAYRNRRISYREYYEKYYVWESFANHDTADAQLSTICGAAKSNGTVIYAIGVEAPQAGLAAMSNCASSPAHYYDVSGAQLEETFASIARTMSVLRLTQ